MPNPEKHTEGPWTMTDSALPASDLAQPFAFDVRTRSGELVAAVVMPAVANPAGRLAEANARLITAAPDLLAACEALIACEDVPGRKHHRKAGGSIACDYCGGQLDHEATPSCPVHLATEAVKRAHGAS